jgi:hypothetical protein
MHTMTDARERTPIGISAGISPLLDFGRSVRSQAARMAIPAQGVIPFDCVFASSLDAADPGGVT